MDRRPVRLLVVEDSAAWLHLILAAFRAGSQSWDITVARDGEKALQMLFAEEEESTPLPDLVLLDWNLPKVNGEDVLRRIKGHPRLLRIPVLVFSTSAADRDIHSAYDGHANGYITKPSDIGDLAAVVEAIERFWIAIARIPAVSRQ